MSTWNRTDRRFYLLVARLWWPGMAIYKLPWTHTKWRVIDDIWGCGGHYIPIPGCRISSGLEVRDIVHCYPLLLGYTCQTTKQENMPISYMSQYWGQYIVYTANRKSLYNITENFNVKLFYRWALSLVYEIAPTIYSSTTNVHASVS